MPYIRPPAGATLPPRQAHLKSLMQAGQFVQVIEERQGLKIGCIEEIAYRNGFIDKEELLKAAQKLGKSGYGEYLMEIC